MIQQSVRTCRSRWKRLAAIAVLGAAWVGGIAFQAVAAPKAGTLKTLDNVEFIGQIDEQANGTVIVSPLDGRPAIQLDRRIVANITYFNTPRDEYVARSRMLGARDAAGWAKLGKWALDSNELALAEQALATAKQIDPRSADVVTLDQAVQARRPKPVATPATQAAAPATQPVTATPASRVAVGPAKRLLTAEEIQRIRYLEMRPREPLRVAVNPEARKRVVDGGLLVQAQARTMSQADLGMLIMEKGDDEMRQLVKIQNDPVALSDYRLKLNKPLLAGCAAAACHGGPMGGNLVLFGQPEREETSLTNFVTLQKFEKDVQGARLLMIDRLQPERSLLLNYMLPLADTATPHPKVEGFRPTARSRQDAIYQMASTWMGDTLKRSERKYEEIDLTAAPPAKAAAAPPR